MIIGIISMILKILKISFIKSNKFIENNKFIMNNILKIKDIRKDDLLNELLIGVESDEIKLTIKNSVFAFRTLMLGFEDQIEEDNFFDDFF